MFNATQGVDPDRSASWLDTVDQSHAARQRVLQLEAALKGPVVTMLQESLRSTHRAAQVPPLGVQLAQCEQFVTRAQKRVVASDEERVKLVSELEEGQARLQRLRVETAQRPQEANPATLLPDWARIAVTRDSVAGREDSVGSKAFGRGVAGHSVGGRRSAARAGFSRCRKRISGTRHHHGRGGRSH